MFKFLHHFEDATVIFGVISLCFLGLCSTLSDISILIFISLPKPFTYKTHISINLKKNPVGSGPQPFQTSLELWAVIHLFFLLYLRWHQLWRSLSTEPSNTFPPSLHLPPFSLPLSPPFSLSFMTICIEYLLCAGYDTKGLGLSHFIKTKQNTHTHPFPWSYVFL